MKNQKDIAMANDFIERVKNFYLKWIDKFENSMLEHVSWGWKTWRTLPPEKANPIIKSTANIMRRVLYKGMDEQKDVLTAAILQFADDKRNGTTFSLNLNLMYDALSSIETEMKQAAKEYLENEEKYLEEESPLWNCCEHMKYSTSGIVSALAEDLQKAMEKSLTGRKPDRQDQDLSL